jgi:hypothetical protein
LIFKYAGEYMSNFWAPFRVSILSLVLSISMSATSFATGEVEAFHSSKPKIQPFFYIDFDWGSWTVNLTPYGLPAVSGRSRDRMVVDDYRSGLQKMSHCSLTGGLGASLAYWFNSAAILAGHLWAYVGIMPILGREVDSVKYFKTPTEAENLKAYSKVPGHARDLKSWSQGDSITYVSRGGVLFAATSGFYAIDVGATALARGSWETYVEKIGSDQVYLKITKGTLASLSVFTGVTLIEVSVTGFTSTDDGFSFLYNMSTEVGRKAYEDAIRGNVIASEKIAAAAPRNYVETTPVMKVSTFKTLTTGRLINAQMGIPIIWNENYSRGKISSFTASEFHLKNKVAKAHYGIYSEEKNFHLWNRNRETDLMFYGSHYTIRNSERTDVGMFGRYSYAYKNDHSDSEKLNLAIYNLVRRTAMNELKVDIPSKNLGYSAIDFDTTLSKENTLHLIDVAQRQGKQSLYKVADRYLQSYSMAKDPYNFCKGESLGPILQHCQNELRDDTYSAIEKMYEALLEMGAEKNRDPKAFARAYGDLGQAIVKNFITFRTILEIAGPGVEINYLLEGSRISMYYKSWITTETPNKWLVVDNPNGRNKNSPFPFEPRMRRSKIRGLIVSPNHGGLEFLQSPPRFGIEGLPLALDTSFDEAI